MKVFIWRRKDDMTPNYHSEGGAVAIAESIERAVELLLKEDANVTKYEPDFSLAVADDAPEYAEVFPDAGCC